MFKTFANAWRIPELRKKILFTLMIIAIFRFGSVVLTVPFVNVEQLRLLFDQYTQNGNLLGYFNVLSGGALQNATLFSMSITPYINASIIIQLLTVAIPALERMQKDGGEEGKKKLAAITRYSTVGIGLLQGFTYSVMLRNQSLLTNTGFWPAAVIRVRRPVPAATSVRDSKAARCPLPVSSRSAASITISRSITPASTSPR